MATAQKIGMAVIGLAVITTLILPGRQTVPVVNAFSQFTQGTLGTAMGTK
jgi:hypothetical protein